MVNCVDQTTTTAAEERGSYEARPLAPPQENEVLRRPAAYPAQASGKLDGSPMTCPLVPELATPSRAEMMSRGAFCVQTETSSFAAI